MNKNKKLGVEVLRYLKDNKPQRINWICIAGGGLPEIQEYDLVFDEKDLELRFPSRNIKLLKNIL